MRPFEPPAKGKKHPQKDCVLSRYKEDAGSLVSCDQFQLVSSGNALRVLCFADSKNGSRRGAASIFPTLAPPSTNLLTYTISSTYTYVAT